MGRKSFAVARDTFEDFKIEVERIMEKPPAATLLLYRGLLLLWLRPVALVCKSCAIPLLSSNAARRVGSRRRIFR